jgi:hypothetical protein
MKGKVLILVAVPLVAFLAVKVHVHLQVRNTMDLLIAQMTPVALVSYGGITSSVDGRIGIQDVTVRPVGLKDEVRIGEVSIKLPSLGYVLQMEDRVRGQELPEALSVKVHDLAVSTRGELVSAWEAGMFHADPAGRERAFQSCVSRTKLPTQMHLLGYQELRGSFEAGYYYDRDAGTLVMHGKVGHMDGVEFSGDLALVMDAFDRAAMARTMNNPEIARGSLIVSDAGYFQRVYDYCQEREDLPRESVAALLTQDLLSMFRGLPLEPDEPLIDAYSEFVSGGSRLVLTAEPRKPKKLEYLSLYDPVDVPAVLNLNAQVN